MTEMILPKCYFLAKNDVPGAGGQDQDLVFFNTEAPIPQCDRIMVSVYANLFTGGVVGTMKITLNFGGDDIDIFGGPADSSAYGSPYIIYKPRSPIRVPPQASLRIASYNDAGVLTSYAGNLALKIIYQVDSR